MGDRVSTTLSLLIGVLVIGSAATAVRADEAAGTDVERASNRAAAELNRQGEADPVSAWLSEAAEHDAEETSAAGVSGDPSTGRFRSRAASGSRERSGFVGSGTDALSLLWPLAIVIAVIVLLAIVFRKYLPGAGRLNGNGAINVLASHYLSNKQSLSLIRIGRRIVLVGVTPDRITSVVEITDAGEVAEVVSTIEKNRPESFTSTLARLYSGRPEDEMPDEEIESDLCVPSERLVAAGANVRNLVDRIRGLSGETLSAEPA